MSAPLRDLYQQLLLSHSAQPLGRGPLPGATHAATVRNPLCGDQVTVRLRLVTEPAAQLAELRTEGEGCAISVASASLLVASCEGKGREYSRQLAERVLRACDARQPLSDEELFDARALLGVREFPARRRCATLPWEALLAALGKS